MNKKDFKTNAEYIKHLDGSLEELNENEIGLEAYKVWNNHLSETQCLYMWISKHIQTKSKDMCAKIARAICEKFKVRNVKDEH